MAATIGAVTITTAGDSPGRPTRHSIAWTSNSGGVVTATVPAIGRVESVQFVPSGTAAPTNAYDVTLTDASSVDLLNGGGANLSNTSTSTIFPLFTASSDGGTTNTTAKRVVCEDLTLNVSNSGNAKQGIIVLVLS